MRKFKHITAGSLEEAALVLRKYGKKARIIAGGTDLLGEMKDDILPEYPRVLVNIKRIAGLDYIREENGNLLIGALTRLEDIAGNDRVKEKFPVLAEAAHRTASPHIREMGTIAGNICQNNRCWYYWVPDNRFYCLRKGGKACYALIGDGRYHSILGASRIIATPCSEACPDNVEIPEYMQKLRDNKKSEAAAILMRHNPLPAITGRVCPHFCEAECNRAGYDEAVSVRGVERSIGDYVLENSTEFYPPPQKNSGKRIAVVGSGPAGLSAAYFLRRQGHIVTVFEKMEEAGGLLTYGIPPYRLPKDVVGKQVSALQSSGIEIKKAENIDRSRLQELMRNYDAVLISTGAWKERPAGIKGEELLISGSEFLRRYNLGEKWLPGKKVAVVGGGNVAIDVARSLLRLGGEPVIIYRRTAAEMPALKDEVEKAVEEKVQMEFLTLPSEAVLSGNKVNLKCVRMELGPLDESGRPRPVPVAGSEFVTEYDAVIKAIGEEADRSILPADLPESLDKKTFLLTKNLFAAGDFAGGPSTVVEAIAAGRKAASSINTFLGGTPEIEKVEEKSCCSCSGEKFNPAFLQKTARSRSPEPAAEERLKDLSMDENSGLTEQAVRDEAARCFNCGCVAVNSSDIAPALIALGAVIKTTKKEIAAENFFQAGVDSTTVLEPDELVAEVRIHLPASGSRSKFIKFALRKSIDFPVVNCAGLLESQNGKVKSARICLNAVYNLPFRVKEAEDFITGKPVNEANAEAAAAAGLKEAFPVLNNSYKIQIARTLVKRVILACGQL